MNLNLNQINLSNIKGFIQGNFRQMLDTFGGLPEHIEEQAIWRLNQVKEKSPECYINDKCSHCGCQVSAKIFEDRGCSANKCYPPLMNEEEWNLFKIKNL